MRELKFRAWDSFNECYTYSDKQVSLYGFFSLYEATKKGENNPILEQFTGLKDKNGKEIYAGDILKINTTVTVQAKDWLFEEPEEVEQEIICSVFYNEEIACFDLETIEPDLHLKNWGFYGNGSDELEIIGNIHEHKNLLK